MLRDRKLHLECALVFGVSRHSVRQKKTCDAFRLIGINRMRIHRSLDGAAYTAILLRQLHALRRNVTAYSETTISCPFLSEWIGHLALAFS